MLRRELLTLPLPRGTARDKLRILKTLQSFGAFGIGFVSGWTISGYRLGLRLAISTLLLIAEFVLLASKVSSAALKPTLVGLTVAFAVRMIVSAIIRISSRTFTD